MTKPRTWGIAAIVGLTAVACSGDFDSTRLPRAFSDRATLGQEIFAVLCDRVGAGVLGEDLSGDSYHSVCHPGTDGYYVDVVDQSKLPPTTGAATLARRLSVAKVEALARRRSEIVGALDVVFPDITIDDPHPQSGSSSKKVRFHEALRVLTQRLSPLYDSNPFASTGGSAEPLLPSLTQALARLFDALVKDPRAQTALARFGGRKGYRPVEVALGAIKPVLLYPELRTLVQQSIRALNPGGAARSEFEQLLRVAHNELATSQTKLALAPIVITDPDGIDQPSRPRDTLEVLYAILLASDQAYGDNTELAPIVMRDPRGFALVAGSQAGLPGTVPLPFVDSFHDGPDGPLAGPDGLADVDEFGRFVDANGNPAAVDAPFDMPGTKRVRDADGLGRATLENGTLAYEYLDTKQTFVASLARSLRALSDPNPANDHETLMGTLAGAYLLLGDRADGTAVYGGLDDLKYSRFDASTSPLVDLAFAAGQVLSDPESDDFIQSLMGLLHANEQDVARLVGTALELKRLADNHPEAKIPPTATLWDEMAEVITKISAVGPADGDPNGRSLMEDLLLAVADDRSLLLGEAYRKFFLYRDRINYNANDINGPVWNEESQDLQAPHTLVDRTSSDSGVNRSAFQRSLQQIVDTTDVTACNKAGARLHLVAGVLGLTVDATYPDDLLFDVVCPTSKQDPVAECSVYEIENLSHFYTQSMLETDPNPPDDFVNRHKATIVVKDPCLASLGGLTDMDKTLEDSSGLLGFTTHPTQTSLARLVFFGSDAASLSMPDLDPTRNTINSKLNLFLADLQEPIGSPLCPKDAAGLNVCSTAGDTLRLRDAATIFLWEHFNFADAMRPLLRAFYDHDREDLFLDLVTVLNRHMSSPNHGPECEKKGNWRKGAQDYNPTYCAESGVVSYEQLLAEQFATDLLPTVNRIAKVLASQQIQSHRFRKANGWPSIARRGTEIAATMMRVLISTDYAKSRQLKNRDGSSLALWNDGVTVKDQVTPYDMFADALKRIDARFASAKGFSADDRAARQKAWKKSRSQLVDEFLAVDGTGTNAKFRNPATPKALVRTLSVLREQLNARCPDREKGGGCEWGRYDLANWTADVIERPAFAALFDLLDKLRADSGRVEFERVLQYLLNFVEDDHALRSVLASSADIVQVMRDEQTLPPVFNVLATLSVPEGGSTVPPKPGAADAALQLVQVLVTEPDENVDPAHDTEFDRYHVVEHVLANLVKPIDETKLSRTPLEVLLDVAGDVNRLDSSDPGPLRSEDVGTIGASVRDFLLSPARGMEQLYTVVRSRNGD